MKPFFAVILLLSLALTSSFIQSTMAYTSDAPSPTPSFCDTKCGERCAKAGYQDRCMRFCNICCQKCQCVPSGTYGNKSECPCYRDWKNSKGASKCP